MITAYKKFWKHYADFTGTSSRSDYWWTVLCHLIIIFPLCALLLYQLFSTVALVEQYESLGLTIPEEVMTSQLLSPLTIILFIILMSYLLATIVPNYAIIVRRLRDAGYHWAYIFVQFVPYVGQLILMVFLCMPSKATNTEPTPPIEN